MRKTIATLILFCCCLCSFAQLQVSETTCENMPAPVGIDVPRPELNWKLSSATRNTKQVAYEIRVAGNSGDLAKGRNLLWSSAKVSSDQSVHVPYGGPALHSSETYYWQVRAWDNHGKSSSWSKVASWQMGFLTASDWKASWIQAGYPEDHNLNPSPMFRHSFAAAKKIRSAVLSITSHGLYEASINGKRIGEAWLTPGFTSYNKRLQYQVYDVSSYIQQGKNAIGVSLGSGWWRGVLMGDGNRDRYQQKLSLFCQLDITYTDGTKEQVVSDKNWKCNTGEVRSSEIYAGETIDARQAKAGWNTPSYDETAWSPVNVVSFDNANLIATINEPVKKHETFRPVKVFRTPRGEQVIDFGQNLVGFVQVSIKGTAGDSLVIHHAEVLDKAGNFYTDNLRGARQVNTYVLSGNGAEHFEPHFTFQGFRYIRIEGYKGDIKPEDFTAVALYSDMKQTGNFSTSNPLLNQLQHNIQWGQNGNFLDIPTDCPQRDERLGWTGDAQAFSRTAAWNRGVENFFRKWLKDVAADQLPNGSVPFVVPNVLGDGASGSAGWADVATIIPWNMYLLYGDKRVLEEQYSSMKNWVNFMRDKSVNDLWNTGFHFGDWLFYRPDDDNDGRAAVTDKYLVAQCFYAHSTQLLINAATVLGNQADVTAYTALLKNIKDAFAREYMTPTGRLVSGTQTAYVLALNFDMLPENLRISAAGRLVANIRDYDYHLTTGFLGTPYLCHVLTRFGYQDVAYTLLMQETYPSWLYPVKMGATTIWERWDGQKPDGSFQNIGMNSFNHYAYGAIGDWMYKILAGVDTDPDAVGYKKSVIHPYISGHQVNKTDTAGLGEATAELETSYGRLSSHWKKTNGGLLLEVEIPANTTSTVWIPNGKASKILEGGKAIEGVDNIVVKETMADYTVVQLGSGRYVFTVSL